MILISFLGACLTSYILYTQGRIVGRRQGLDMAQMMIAGHVLRRYNVVSIHDIPDAKDRKDADDLLKVIGWDR